MKKLILGLLSAAIIILSFTACQQSSTPTPVAPVTPVVTNTAPVISKAIFMNASDLTSNMTWGQAQEKEVKTLEKSKNYKLAIYWTDADANTNRVQVCKNNSFETSWQWTFTLTNPSAQRTGNWVTWDLNFPTTADARDYFTNQNNRSLYVRMLDTGNKISEYYIISGITITD